MKMILNNEIGTFVHELGGSAELLGAQARAGLETLAGAALYLMQEGFGRVGGRRMAAALSALTGISMLLSACGPSQSGRQTGETQPAVTAVEPTETKLPPQIEATPTAIILNKSEFGIVQSNETDPQKIKLEEKYAQTIIAEAKHRIASLSAVPEKDIQYLQLGRVMPDGSVATTAELILAKNSENPAINNLYLVSQINGSRVEEVYSPLFVDDTGELAKIVYIDPSTGNPKTWMEEIQGESGKMTVYLLGGGTLEVELDLISAMSSGKSASLIDMHAMPQYTEGENGPQFTLGDKTYVLDIAKGEWVEQIKGYITDLQLKETSKIESYTYGKEGPTLNVSVNVDQTAWSHGVKEVIMPDALAADVGIDMLHALVAPDMDRDEFVHQLAEVQRGERPASDLSITANFYDANKRMDEPEEMTLILGGDGQPSGEKTVVIKDVTVIYGEWYENPEQGVFKVSSDTPWLDLISPAGNEAGVMVDVTSGRLYVFVGFNYLASETINDKSVATDTMRTVEWLKFFHDGKKLFDKNGNRYSALGKSLLSAGLVVND